MSDVTNTSHRREFVREAVTMALYLSLSLLAVLLARPSNPAQDPVGLLFLTAVALLVAHLLAFAISSRLVSKGVFDAEARLIAFAQICGGALVVTMVMVPLLLFDAPTSVRVSEGLLLGAVGGVGYAAARQADVSRGRAFVYVVIVVASAVLVLLLKAAVGH